MPADPENSTYLGYLMALLFGGGGAAKLVTHEGRIKSLESRSGKHSEKLEEVHGTLQRLDERSEAAIADRKRMEEKIDRLLGKL